MFHIALVLFVCASVYAKRPIVNETVYAQVTNQPE